MIVRKSLVDTAKDYLKNCSLAGIQHICDSESTIKKRLLWTVAICTAFGMVCHYSATFIFYSSYTKPLTISVKSVTYPIKDIDFPAVGLCNVNKISKKALQEQVEKTFIELKGNVSRSEINHYYLDMANLINFKFNKNPMYMKSYNVLNSWINNNVNIKDLMKKLLLVHQTGTYWYIELSRVICRCLWVTVVICHVQLAPNCTEMLVKCSWAGSVSDCTNMFSLRRTIHGHCCVFNYVLDYNSADKPGIATEPIKKQIVPGPDFGLNVIIDPLLYDYTFPSDMRTGFDVYMFDPNNFLYLGGGRVIQGFAQVDQENTFHIDSTKQTASSQIRIYSFKTRRCRFRDEVISDFKIYSYSACLVKCKLQSIHSLCKCTPFFLPSAMYKYDRICSLRDLKCLNKFREKFLYLYPLDTINMNGLAIEKSDSLYCPSCYPDCELTRHHVKSLTVFNRKTNKKKEFKNYFLNGVNLTNKCFISIYQTDSAGLLLNLELVAQWYEVLANFGGFAGMFMGLGVFTFIELIYFLLLRLIKMFCTNYSKYH